MKPSIGLALALGFGAIAFSAEATEKHNQPTQAVEQSSPPAEPAGFSVKPYAHPDEGDYDGLSRDPDECNKGCIGGNPG